MEGISLGEFRKKAKIFQKEIEHIRTKLDNIEKTTGKTKLNTIPKELEIKTDEAIKHLKRELKKLN